MNETQPITLATPKPIPQVHQVQGLQGEVTVQLHTHYAIRAVRGRKQTEEQRQIVGLYQFTSRMNTIYQAAGHDDPFALFVLVGLEAELERVQSRLNTRQQRINNCLSEHNDQIVIEKAKSVKPEVLNVNVSHYGFKVLDLIVLMDKLCCDALNAIHRSRITTREGRQINEKSAEDIRGLLSSGAFYRFTGIDREDLRQKNQRAQQAVDKLIESRFINRQHFGGFDDIATFFANYDQVAEFGPEIKVRKRVDGDQGSQDHESTTGIATNGNDDAETLPKVGVLAAIHDSEPLTDSDNPTTKVVDPKPVSKKKRATKKAAVTHATSPSSAPVAASTDNADDRV